MTSGYYNTWYTMAVYNSYNITTYIRTNKKEIKRKRKEKNKRKEKLNRK